MPEGYEIIAIPNLGVHFYQRRDKDIIVVTDVPRWGNWYVTNGVLYLPDGSMSHADWKKTTNE